MAEHNEQSPQHEPVANDDADIKSKKVTLADLSAKGTTLYAHKKYAEAAEFLSEASSLQAELNGETAPENAEILFHYGRCLFKVGQSKSDVLGGQAPAPKKSKNEIGKANGQSLAEKAEDTVIEKAVQEGAGSAGQAESKPAESGNNPLFQLTGDQNFDDSDDELQDEEQADEEEEGGEEDDDLATAFEILDLARVCYLKLLDKLCQEEVEEGKGNEKQVDSSAIRHVKERLAETHDALAEISLENERYQNAIEDGRVALKYKMELYPEESEIIAEMHYKLSLALEFASVTTTGEDGAADKREDMDQGLRTEAATEMELAIKSSKLKLQNKEVELAAMASPEENDFVRIEISEMKEVIAEMEQRLTDLRSNPLDAKKLLGDDGPVSGLLGALAGESATQTKARIDEATKHATDLTSLVRKKPQEKAPSPSNVSEASNKRKAEDDAEEEDSAKKAKVEASAEA